MNTKKWYTSKTIWINVLAIASEIALTEFGVTISPELGVIILGAINFVLRLITKTAIEW